MASVRLDAVTIAELTRCRKSGEVEDGRPPACSDVSLPSILDSEQENGSVCSSIIPDELGDIAFTDDESDFADEDELNSESPGRDWAKKGGHAVRVGAVAAEGLYRNSDFCQRVLHSPSHSEHVTDGPPENSLSTLGRRQSTKKAAPITDAGNIVKQEGICPPQLHSQVSKEDDSNNIQTSMRPGKVSSITSGKITINNDRNSSGSPRPISEVIPTVACKILVVGNAKSGKSSIINRFINNRFMANYSSTVGVDYAMKDVPLGDGNKVRLQLWDIAGQDRFVKLTRAYFRRAKGAVVVCDVTREGTFNAIIKWKEELDLWCRNEGHDLPVYLFANKCDLLTNAQESFLAGARMEKTCRQAGFNAWYATSAKRGDNIPQAMTELLQDALEMELQRNRVSLEGEGAATKNGSGSTRESSRSAFRLSSREAYDGGRRLAQQACFA